MEFYALPGTFWLAPRGAATYGCVNKKLTNLWLPRVIIGSNEKAKAMVANRIDLAIGSQIRRQRNTLRMSISDLSISIGVPEFEVAQFENGTKRLSASVLVRLCKIFGVGVVYFFDAFELELENKAEAEAVG